MNTFSKSPLPFGTKAETLESLAGRLTTAEVLPMVRATARQWAENPEAILNEIDDKGWGNKPLIVRSSALSEDDEQASLAGHFLTLSDVTGRGEVAEAILKVIGSFEGASGDDQFFVQPFLSKAAVTGVAFGRDPNSKGPYRVIEYDSVSGSTASITGGLSNDIQHYVHHQQAPVAADGFLGRVLALLDELEKIFATDALDVEFAVANNDTLYLLQVRLLAIPMQMSVTDEKHREIINEIAEKIVVMGQPHPYLLGERTVFGVMPDWNPAEIIGLRPRPLALSLYRDMVTDFIWAYQRDNYGYRNLRSFPLMIDFHGLPYIDVRVSFNSFIPKELNQDLATKIVEYYIGQLLARKELHDKVEFEIVFSCYTLDLSERIKVLLDHGLVAEELKSFEAELRSLTNRIIRPDTGLMEQDRIKISKLEERLPQLEASKIDRISRIYWLLEDCKRYGTLPFAGLARAGFVAVQMLHSLERVGIFEEDEINAFMASIHTVSSDMQQDFATLDRERFLDRHGHLRPGTYDILSPRYDEAPDQYFDWKNQAPDKEKASPGFSASASQLRRIDGFLAKDKLTVNALELLDFIRNGIELREHAKFVFTKNISNALMHLKELGRQFGFSVEDLSYMDIGVIRELYSGCWNPEEIIGHNIEKGKKHYAMTRQLLLPPTIDTPEHAWSFNLPSGEPNFITQLMVQGPVVRDKGETTSLKGAILMIPNIDPGYDWIFSHDIGGFITAYGGANSHMAIRACEQGVPAVIGAGQASFELWSRAQLLRIDCSNHQVQVLK